MALPYRNGNSDTSTGKEVLRTLDNHVSLQLSTLGAALIVVGYLIQFLEVPWTNTGVWSAIMAVWGAVLLFFGLLVYSFIWWSHQ